SRQNTLEARLSSAPISHLETIVGAFVLDEAIRTPPDGFFRPFNLFNFSLQRPNSGVNSNSAFGRATYHVTDRLRAIAGVRYTHERKYLDGEFEGFSKQCQPIPTASCPNAQPFDFGITTEPVVFPTEGSSTGIPVHNPDG